MEAVRDLSWSSSGFQSNRVEAQSAFTPSNIDSEGRRLPDESKTMSVGATNLCPLAAAEAERLVPIGDIAEVVVIKSPADAGRSDPPNVWQPPAWMVSGERW